MLRAHTTAGLLALGLQRVAAAPPLAALRPRQWTKNLLLFAGLIFAERFGDTASWASAAAVFCAYCAVSSSAYLVNDVRDAEHDRRHPTKRFRPVASGALSERVALAGAAALLATGLAVAAALGPVSVAYLAGFAAIQASYSLVLKRIVLVDVLTIAGLFVLRASAGAAAVGVRISPWLLVCTALLALFLGLAKRRSELVLVAADRAPGRPVLRWYSLRMLDGLVATAALAVVCAYALYALTARESASMATTIPFVVFGLGRYLHLVYRHELGEEPEQVLLTDRAILACVACWVVAAVVALTS